MKKHICVACRKKLPEDEMYYGPDPWNAEMHGNHTNVWECRPCYNTSLDDI